MNITEISDITWRELGSPSDESIPSISFFYSTNLGILNNLISANFSIDSSNEISPELSDAEAVIYKYIYMISYYNRQVQKNLGAGAYTSNIQSIKEGGRDVKMYNRTDRAKVFLSLVDSLKQQLDANIYAYNSNQALPYQIDIANPIIQEDFLAQTRGPYPNWPYRRS